MQFVIQNDVEVWQPFYPNNPQGDGIISSKYYLSFKKSNLKLWTGNWNSEKLRDWGILVCNIHHVTVLCTVPPMKIFSTWEEDKITFPLKHQTGNVIVNILIPKYQQKFSKRN